MIKVIITQNGEVTLPEEQPKYNPPNLTLFSFNNCIAKFPKRGKYYFADYVRYFYGFKLKDEKQLSKEELKLVKC